ncbi:MAG TPA: hypothetical protein VFJ16_24505 [Longimicrobium sp.]|nr:hypothetical protein [Longimicrobium sp.]
MGFAEADAEFERLLPGLPERIRRRFVREFAARIVAGRYAGAGVAPPRWVREATQPSREELMTISADLHALRNSDPDQYTGLVLQLRDAATRYVASTSLRQAAREIGMSPTGLQKFLDGAEPYVKTVRKLSLWRERTQPPAG